MRRRGIGWRMACFVLLLFMAPCAMAQQGQTFTVSFKANTLEEVFDYLSKNSDYVFTYNSADLRQEAKRVTHDFKNATLAAILDECLKGTAFTYEIIDRHVVVKKREEKSESVTVKGIVYDEKRQPLPGVTVQVVGTSVGTATTSKGWFSIGLPMLSGRLKLSFVGYKDKEVEFTEKTATDTLRIYMEENVEELDEAIVVAYGETTRRKATGSISVVKADEIRGIPTTSIANLLQGRVAGMDVTNMSGAPGGGGTTITIRGYNSLDVEQGRRFSDPLWVVDGVPLNSFTSPVTGTNLLADINPESIESIQVLKDAASAAIYGSRAANGVIIVTTKKGRKNQEADFSVNFSQTWSILPELPPLTIGKAERLFRIAAVKNSPSAYYDVDNYTYKYPESIEEVYWQGMGSIDGFWSSVGGGSTAYKLLLDSLNSFYNNATNYFPLFYEKGKVTNANIQVYGGSERIAYGVGFGFYDESGIVKGSGFNRFDLNSTLNITPVNHLNIDLRFNATLNNRKRGDRSTNDTPQSVETVPGSPYELSTFYPGEGSAVYERVLEQLSGTKEKNRSVRLRTNFKIGYDVLPGLNVSASLAADYSVHRRNYFQPSTLAPDGYSITLGETGVNLMVLNEELVSYSKTFKEDHSLNVLAGFSYQYDQTEYNMGSAKNAPSDKIHYAPSGMPELGESGYGDYTETIAFQHYESDMYEKILMSYFARVEYDYRNKYLFSFCFRGDGSSTFGKGNKWGTFPAVAVGWSFSEENWVKENLGWLSFGKIRASWGRSGKTFEQPYTAAGILQIGKDRITNEPTTFLNGSILEPNWNDGLYNEELTWEETDQYDIGLDMDLLDYRLGVTLDYYYRYTDKLLQNVAIDYSINAYETQWRNAAAISNEGLELLVRYEIFREKDLYWKVSVNGAKNWNRLKETYDGKDLMGMVIGKSVNEVQAYQVTGFINDAEEVPFYYANDMVKTYLYPQAGGVKQFFKPGDYMLMDVDGDGCVSYGDRVTVGSALPVIQGGLVSEFQWKSVDVNLSITYQLERHMANMLLPRSLALNDQGRIDHPIFTDLREVSLWQQPGDNEADYPKNQNYNFLYANVMSAYVEKVNWLKLKTLSIGYSLPERWTRHVGMKQLRVFVSGENLLTFSNYSGIDPETVVINYGVDDGKNYPLARRYTVGLTIKF